MTFTIDLSPPHPAQVNAWQGRSRYTALRCGRRWGKTQLAISILVQKAAQGEFWGLFAPDYKILSETYRELEYLLRPIIASSSKIDGIIRLVTGGRIDFWTLNNPRAGRSRKYHGVVIDEAAFAGPDMADIWTKAIKPTLLDYGGVAWAMSTPAGKSDTNWFYNICNPGNEVVVGERWTEFHAPTHTNPYLPAAEIAQLQVENAPDVFRQEYLAEFVDWNGVSIFPQEHFLIDGEPVPCPNPIDFVFATIDTGVKTGSQNDGTAVVFYAVNNLIPIPLYVLDWDIIQIQGDLLDSWLPGIFERLEQFARECGARYGSNGAFIEDKASGMVLVQQALRRGWPVEGIDSKLTAVGKDERALSTSSYHHQGLCKITPHAFAKTVIYKGRSANHFLSQVCGFRLGVKDQADDLLDCLTYGLAGALGDAQWF